MTRRITIPAGERTRVFVRRFSSIPQTIRFTAEASPPHALSGTVERVGSRWVLERTTSSAPLGATNEIRRGYWDTLFEVFVTPDAPVTVTIGRPHMSRRLLITALVLGVIWAAAALVAWAVG